MDGNIIIVYLNTRLKIICNLKAVCYETTIFTFDVYLVIYYLDMLFISNNIIFKNKLTIILKKILLGPCVSFKKLHKFYLVQNISIFILHKNVESKLT